MKKFMKKRQGQQQGQHEGEQQPHHAPPHCDACGVKLLEGGKHPHTECEPKNWAAHQAQLLGRIAGALEGKKDPPTTEHEHHKVEERRAEHFPLQPTTEHETHRVEQRRHE
jgi:hypothetical protein